MSGYVLAPTAQNDLIAIRDYYLQEAGYRLARQVVSEFVEAFRTLARNPALGHKRQDLTQNDALLFWTLRDYLIVYRAETMPVQIVVIARGSRDMARIISRWGL